MYIYIFKIDHRFWWRYAYIRQPYVQYSPPSAFCWGGSSFGSSHSTLKPILNLCFSGDGSRYWYRETEPPPRLGPMWRSFLLLVLGPCLALEIRTSVLPLAEEAQALDASANSSTWSVPKHFTHMAPRVAQIKSLKAGRCCWKSLKNWSRICSVLIK